MDEADQEKTSFVTSQGLFCYEVMPFGLKNAKATYQRLVNHMFRPQIGRNVEVYVKGGVRGGREGALAPPNPAQNFPFLCIKILYSYLILLY